MHPSVLSTFELLLLGMGIGLVTLIPPGPVTLTLIELGTARGRRTGVRAGFAVAAGDVLVGFAAVATLALTTSLPPAALAVFQGASVMILVGLGLTLVFRPAAVQAAAASIVHPARSMFAICTLTPSVFGAWVALLGAMPFARNTRALVVFTCGVIAASMLWHLALGGAAGTLGSRLTPAAGSP